MYCLAGFSFYLILCCVAFEEANKFVISMFSYVRFLSVLSSNDDEILNSFVILWFSMFVFSSAVK